MGFACYKTVIFLFSFLFHVSKGDSGAVDLPTVLHGGPALDLAPVPAAEVYLAAENEHNLSLLSKAGNAEIVINGKMLRKNNTLHNVILVCNADFPIQWTYEGDGVPARMYSSEIRTVENLRNESSYEYFSTLVLMPERHNEHFTGTYVCQGLTNPEMKTFYHLYFPGHFGFPTIRNRVLRVSVNETRLRVPCMMTNPKMDMNLYKIFPKDEVNNLSNSTALTFDPRSGYVLDLTQVRNPYGTYYCSINGKLSFWKIDIVPPLEEDVQVEPNLDLVNQENFENATFTCSSKEPLVLTFPNSIAIGSVEYGHNESLKFPYFGILRLDPNFSLFSSIKYLKINCITERTRRILHSWEHSSIGSEELSITYLPNSQRMLCCAKSGLSPIYEFVKCETRTDCLIKRNCFTNGRCEYPFPPKYVDAPFGCTAIEFTERVPTHVAKCSVGEKSRVVPIIENVQGNDILLDENGSVPATDDILKLTVIKTEKREVKVKCSGSLYYFAMNFIFGIERIDGSMEYANTEAIEMLESHEPLLRMIDMDKTVRRIVCFAPLSFSAEWRNVSMSVNITEPIKSRSSHSSSSTVRQSRADFTRRRPRQNRI